MKGGWLHPWTLFMGAWIGLFIGPNVTGNLFFGAAMGLMVCGLTASIFTNWRGIGRAMYQWSNWTRHGSLNYPVFRWTTGGAGFLIALIVTVGSLGKAIASAV